MEVHDLEITPYGHYGLIERIGSGGMAEIYLGVSEGVEGFRKLVAVKRIHEHYALNERFRGMFINEAKLAAMLQHPNAVQIYDLGEIDGQLFIAMEYVGGVDLARILQGCAAAKHGLPLEVVLFIVHELLRGLDYAHKKKGPSGTELNLIHRDVSPSNVLVSIEGIVKLCDFGIAKAAHVASHSQAGMLKGKVCYMSPETVRGDPIDHRVDIWAAGVVLWELLAVRRLYLGPHDYSMMERIAAGERTPITEMRQDLDESIVAIVDRALEPDREQRYQSAGEMANDIARAAGKLGLLLSPDPLREYMQAHIDDTLVDVNQITSSLAAMPKEELTRSVKVKPDTVFSPDDIGSFDEILKQAEAALDGSAAGGDGDSVAEGVGVAQSTELDLEMASKPVLPAMTALDDTPENRPTAPIETPAAAPDVELAAQRAATQLSTPMVAAAPVDPNGREQRRRRSSFGIIFFVVGGLGLAALLWLGLNNTLGGPPSPTAALMLRSTPPGATVRIEDGELLGKTPLQSEDLAAGTVRLNVELEGFAPQQLELELVAGVLQQEEVLLLPLRADAGARVDATAAIAQVKQPDAAIAQVKQPDAAIAQVKQPDAAIAQVKQPDAATRPSDDAPAGLPVKGPRAWLTVWAKPWGYVSIDGVRLDKPTPLRDHALVAGEHDLVVENPHLHRKLEKKIRLKPGQKLRLRVDMTRDPPTIK